MKPNLEPPQITAQKSRDWLSAIHSQKWGWWWVGHRWKERGNRSEISFLLIGTSSGSVSPLLICVIFIPRSVFTPVAGCFWAPARCSGDCCLVFPTPGRAWPLPACIPTVSPAGLSWLLSLHSNCLSLSLPSDTEPWRPGTMS